MVKKKKNLAYEFKHYSSVGSFTRTINLIQVLDPANPNIQAYMIAGFTQAVHDER